MTRKAVPQVTEPLAVGEVVPKRLKDIGSVMDEEVVALLDRFHLVINQRLKEKGWPQVTRPRVAGAILADFLLARRNEIFEDAAKLSLKKVLRRAERAFGESDLESLHIPPSVGIETPGASGAAHLSDVPRTGRAR